MKLHLIPPIQVELLLLVSECLGGDIVSQVITLGAMVCFITLFHKQVKAHPSLFYILAVVLACVGIYLTYTPATNGALRAFAYAVQKGHLGFSLLVVVMFVGVFRDGSVVRKALQPIRGELSLIAAILMVAHVIPYVASYSGMIGALGSLKPSVLASLGIAAVIVVLLIVLSVTSMRVVKQTMRADSWKRVQWLAYVFFGLIFFHMLGYMMVPMLAGSFEPSITLAFYTAVYAVYVVARLRRYAIDRRVR